MGRVILATAALAFVVACGDDDDEPRDRNAVSIKTAPVVDLGSVSDLDKEMIEERLREALMEKRTDEEFIALMGYIDTLLDETGEESRLHGVACKVQERLAPEDIDGYTHRRLDLVFANDGLDKCFFLLNVKAFDVENPSGMLQLHEDQHARISDEVLAGVAQKCCDKARAENDDPTAELNAAFDAINTALKTANETFDMTTMHGTVGDQEEEATAQITKTIGETCN